MSNKQQAVQGEDKDGRRDFLFVFIDIVNFTRLTDTGQLNTLIQKFYELVAGALRGNDSGLEQWLSTGDGGIAVFQAEKEDEGKQNAVRNRQETNPKPDQGKIQQHQHNIPDIHAADHSPKELGMIFDEHRSGTDAMDQQRAQQEGHNGIARQPQGQQGNKI